MTLTLLCCACSCNSDVKVCFFLYNDMYSCGSILPCLFCIHLGCFHFVHCATLTDVTDSLIQSIVLICCCC